MFRTLLKLSICTCLLAAVLSPVLARDTDFTLLSSGSLAPDFTAQSYTGGTMHLSGLRGKVVVLDFWATWCGPCNASMPHLQEIRSRYSSKDVEVLALCVWDTPDDANHWIPGHPQYTFHYALDPVQDRGKGISTNYLVNAIPSTYIIDTDGKVVDAGTCLDESEIAKAVDKAIAQSREEARAELANKPLPAVIQPVGTTRPLIQAHETLLFGTVLIPYDSVTGTFQIAAMGVAGPKSKLQMFSASRLKTIDLDDSTPEVEALAAGAPVFVVGTDGGVGKDLNARVVQPDR